MVVPTDAGVVSPRVRKQPAQDAASPRAEFESSPGAGPTTTETRRRPRKPFVSALGHELRGPLNAIVGFSDLLLEGMAGALGDEQRDYLERVRGAGQRLAEMHGKAIEILKIQSGACAPDIEEFSLTDMIRDVARGWEDDCRAKNISVESAVPDDLNVEADRSRLAQCLTVLMSNAVEYTDEGGVSISASENGGMVSVSVKDTGRGIAETDLPFVFEPFARIGVPLEGRGRGTELGLFLLQTVVVTLLKGSVSVRSRAGKGSEFLLEFPKTPRAVS